MKCEVCTTKMPFSIKNMVEGVAMCEKCRAGGEDKGEKIPLPEFLEGHVESFDGLPEHVKEKLLKKLEKEGIDPDDILAVNVKGLLESLKEAGITSPEDIEDLNKRFELLRAREAYKLSCRAALATLHMFKHIGMDESEIMELCEEYTQLEYRIVQNFLFHGEDGAGITLEQLRDHNERYVSQCDHGEDDDDD